MATAYVPLPVIVPGARVTSWTLFSPTAPRLPTCAPSAGLAFQVIDSVQAVLATVWKVPPLVESLVTDSRSVAELTLAPAGRPDTVNFRNDCLAVVEPPTACRSAPLLPAVVGVACET